MQAMHSANSGRNHWGITVDINAICIETIKLPPALPLPNSECMRHLHYSMNFPSHFSSWQLTMATTNYMAITLCSRFNKELLGPGINIGKCQVPENGKCSNNQNTYNIQHIYVAKQRNDAQIKMHII